MSILPNYIIPVNRLIINKNTGEWCKIQYSGHKEGCPNYNKSDRCPPKVMSIEEYMNINKPMFLVHSEFNLKNHMLKMKEKHPEWSDKQCRCVLYWQNTSRKQMKNRVIEAVSILKTDRITACPEGMGVNVFATAAISGLKLEKIKDLEICRHISLIGYKNEY